MKRVVTFIIVIILASSTVYASSNENVYYSVLFPGWGQIRSDHYGKGSLFMGTEIVSLLSIVVTQIQYNRAVEQYDKARRLYLSADYIGDALKNYNSMNKKWDDADRLYGYRTAMIGAAAGVWALNVVDMLFFSKEQEGPLSLRVKDRAFYVCTGFRF